MIVRYAIINLFINLFNAFYYVPNVSYKIRDFCIDDSGVTLEIVEYLQDHPNKNLIDEEQQYVYCILIESQILSEDGEIQVEKFEELKKNDRLNVNIKCLTDMKVISSYRYVYTLKKCYN